MERRNRCVLVDVHEDFEHRATQQLLKHVLITSVLYSSQSVEMPQLIMCAKARLVVSAVTHTSSGRMIIAIWQTGNRKSKLMLLRTHSFVCLPRETSR